MQKDTNLRDIATLHPLVSVINFDKVTSKKKSEIVAMNFGIYAIFLKEGKKCELHYGRNNYDFQDGTLVYVAPGQSVKVQHKGANNKIKGYALLFHPDLLLGTTLNQKMNQYSFFSYDVHEALHISQKERQILLECLSKIEYELEQGIDKHSKNLIVSNIELFLDYSVRFYERQFITRGTVHQGTIAKLESLLNEYFQSDKPSTIGVPSVSHCAEQLQLSANYFGDLIKNETGKTAQEYIQTKLIRLAKEKMFDPTKSIREVAYELGFKYPQHFSRFFKQQVGYSPKEYRKMN